MIYRITITYTLQYPNGADTYTEVERVYKEDYIKALEAFEESKHLNNVTKIELDKIVRLGEWKNGI